MTKIEALIHLRVLNNMIHETSDYKECVRVAIECIQESITAEELKSDLSNNFEGVPI